MAFCLVPGCGKELSRWATTGVCKPHSHEQGYCHCTRCVRLSVQNGIPLVPMTALEVKEPPKKHVTIRQRPPSVTFVPRRHIPGTKIVEQPYHATTTNALGKMLIRMPVTPWD